MGRILRRVWACAACVLIVSLTVTAAAPAKAGPGKGAGAHDPESKGVGQEQPPGLVGNDHAQAKGQTKKAPAAASNEVEPDGAEGPSSGSNSESSPVAGVKSAHPKGPNADQGGGSSQAHHHVIVCHRTGSASNPYVVLNIPWTAWSGAHDPASSHAHPALDGRVDGLLADPASRPGAKDGFTAADCVATGTVAPPPAPPSPPPAGGVSGGALGEEAGSPGRGQLPFTGFPGLVVILAALGAAVSAAGIARGTGKKSQGLQRRAR